MSIKYRILKILHVICIVSLITYSPQKSESVVKSGTNQDGISFSGYQWNIKTSSNTLVGPGPNYFNDSIHHVWVDTYGFLHLRITHNIYEDIWYCAEIFSVESFGYGTYQFTLAPGFDLLDKNVVLGLFTYLDDFNEIDIEFAKWGNDENENGQYVLQPSWKMNHKKRFNFISNTEDSIHGFKWCKNSIRFWSLISENEVRWIYFGPGIPEPSTEHVNINLWLMQGLAPSNFLEAEVIIKSFEFIPFECLNCPIGFWWVACFSIVGFVAIITIITIVFWDKKRRMKSKLL
ncbi:MAG: glycoside hydrolase family 16 protein [Candidatus Lokiarchaeota archaeon]|nr:glycoside hydrolase family 16 protein [Candidatus Lokiarchaeota archaeon]